MFVPSALAGENQAKMGLQPFSSHFLNEESHLVMHSCHECSSVQVNDTGSLCLVLSVVVNKEIRHARLCSHLEHMSAVIAVDVFV